MRQTKQWTLDDERMALALDAQNKPVSFIAQQIGRTEKSVIAKLYQLKRHNKTKQLRAELLDEMHDMLSEIYSRLVQPRERLNDLDPSTYTTGTNLKKPIPHNPRQSVVRQ